MSTEEKRKIKFAVVGLGHFEQTAVIPAFENAKDYCELTALVSGDAEKLAYLGKQLKIDQLIDYKDYESFLRSGAVDAVYIVLPNTMHCEFTVKAAEAGVHVLCEKPLAVDEEECRQMIDACESNNVRLMTAYRLHFEEANMKAVEAVTSGMIGEPRIFNSVFTMQVREGNIRTQEEKGGGVLPDLGVYCINAARYIFRSEPLAVTAFTPKLSDPRFTHVDGLTGALLDFGEGRLATFVVSFDGSSTSSYKVVGTEGSLELNPAYNHEAELKLEITSKGETKAQSFPVRDHIAPELIRFSECILEEREPESSGYEGLADVRIIDAIYRSARERKTIDITPLDKRMRPDIAQSAIRAQSSKVDDIGVEKPQRS